MLGNIFLKTLYEKRWSLIGWGLGTFVLVLYVISVFHTFSGGTFDATLKQLPESMKGLLGDTSSYNSISGYVHQQIFVRTFPIFIVVFAVILFTGVLAGDEGEGTLQVLLAQPVSRTKVLMQKYFGAVTLSAALCFIVFLACLTAVPLIHESVSALGVFESSFGLLCITLTFGSMAFMIGAATGKRGMAGSIAGAVAFASFLISSLAVGVKSLEKIDLLSPFHYYSSSHNVIKDGLEIKNILVLLALSIIFTVLAEVIFLKRDIYQR